MQNSGDDPGAGLAPDLGSIFGGVGVRRQAKTVAQAKASEVKPINERLSERRPPIQHFKARQYQTDLYLKTLMENVVIYLGTGLGKTFVTVLYIKSPHIAEQIQIGKKVIFLAPTQDLVKQQAEYIYTKVDYKVRVYCGRTCHLGLHIDKWKESEWTNQFAEVDILFMTPQIFASAICTALIKWSQVSAVIFDECHHAATSKNERSGKNGGHPYSRILNHHQQFCRSQTSYNKPRIIGLTASLINNMPKNVESIIAGVRDLERKLDAKCVTDLFAIESKPKMLIFNYTKPALKHENDVLLKMFSTYAKCMEEALSIAKARKISDLGPTTNEEREVLAYFNRLKLASSGFSIKPGSFHKVLRQLAAIRANSGLWTLTNICYNLHEVMLRHSNNSVISSELKPVYTAFAAILGHIVETVGSFLGDRPEDYLLAYSQPKLLALLEALKNQYNEVLVDESGASKYSCIVFVKSRVEVVAICSWLQAVSAQIPGYDFIKANYAIGLAATMASKWSCITKRKSAEQSKMLEDFRRGQLNVIVTTSVLEEGIDLPVCSTVIRYDKASTFRVYVQSRGRARQKASYYVAMCEDDNIAETQLEINRFNDFEERIKDFFQTGMPGSSLNQSKSKPLEVDDVPEDIFTVPDKEIQIDASMAKIILHMYCTRLAHRNPYSDGLTYERTEVVKGEKFQTTLFFPPGCPVKDSVRGSARSTLQLADNSTLVAAFRVLYNSGELDEHGVPIRATEEHMDKILSKYKLQPDFSPIDRSLEGELQPKTETDTREAYAFPWKLFNIGTCLMRGYSLRTFKLYRLIFKAAADDKVRHETRPHFEQQVLGLIVDEARDPSAWPNKLHSHYGEFTVDYKLIEGKLELNEYSVHNKYMNHTMRLCSTFWNFDKIRKEDFRERCLFYIVPLDENNNIDANLIDRNITVGEDCLTRIRDIQPNEIIRKNSFYLRHGEAQSVFTLKAIHWEMNPHSRIPGYRNGKTFYEQAVERHGHNVIRDFHQPIFELVPIARQLASPNVIKTKRAEYSSDSEFHLAQTLDRFNCSLPIAFQAYNLPPIIYSIYLTSLANILDDKFMTETQEHRRNVIHRQILPPYPDDALAKLISDNESDDEQENEKHMDIEAEDEEQDFPEEEIGEEEDIFSDSSDEYDTQDELSSDTDDSDDPKPSNTYLNILSRQKFNLSDRGDTSGMEQWDTREYDVPDLKTLTFEHKAFRSSQKYVDTNPKFQSTFGSLESKTLNHMVNIVNALSEFRKGIVADQDFMGEDGNYDRPSKQVDLSREAPVKFDRASKPLREKPREMHFAEALTQRRAGERHNLEALENVGDSYLKYCVSVILFKYVDTNEGQLTLARSRLVSNKHFTHLAKKNKLGFYAITNKYDPSVLASAMGAREVCKNVLRNKDLADIFESLIGACLVYRSEFEAIMAMKWLGLNIFADDAFAELHENSVIFSKPKSALVDEDDRTRELFRKCQKKVARFEEIINYKFSDPSYLIQAFCHATAPERCTESYERLEFLGDAILDFLTTITLYNAGYTTDPGQITSSRSALVNNSTFAKLAIQYKFDVYIQHANQELFDELSDLNDHVKMDPELKFFDDFKFDKISKILADVFESVAGAIYVDSGCSLDTVYRIYYPMMKDFIDAEIANPTKNIIRELHEYYTGQDRIKYEFLKSDTGIEGSDDTTTCKLSIFGLEPFYGEGLSNSQAKKRAVACALENKPNEANKKRLDEDYMAILRERGILIPGARRGRGGRGGGRGGSRGRGFRGGGGGPRGFRGQTNFSRRDQQPYPQRGDSGRGDGSRAYGQRQHRR